MYELIPTKIEETHLHYRLDGEAAERHGAIGYLRADFGGGKEFYSTWFDSQSHLKTAAFKAEFDNVINALRDDGEKPPCASRRNLEAFCGFSPNDSNFTIRTLDYSYYFRFRPMRAHYDIYCYAYDNRYLLPELAGKHEMPNDCYCILPSSDELVIVIKGESGYYPTSRAESDPTTNRQIAAANNALLGVTRAQEAAMLAGSMFGWDVPAAKPWNYDQNGTPRHKAPQKDELTR